MGKKIKDQILLSALDLDKMIETMQECDINTDVIPFSELLKIATAMELYKLINK